MATSKTITCMDCGHHLTVVAWRYHYPRCPVCGQQSFECTATGGCPRCAKDDRTSDHAFDRAERAFERWQEDMCIYRGHPELANRPHLA